MPLSPHLRGHALIFEARPRSTWDSSTGLRLLLAFVLLEGVLGRRLSLLSLLRLAIPAWLHVPLLLVAALLLVRYFAGLRPSEIGLRPWRDWTTTERSYLIQVLVLLTVVSSVLLAGRWRRLLADSSLWAPAAVVLITYFIWGFYQEVAYRGMLQNELVRRWGPLPGILVGNIVFTFGPLHLYHLSGASPLPMFAGIFAIGLFFGVVLWRSGNLWLVGAFHGLGDVYFTGLPSIGR